MGDFCVSRGFTTVPLTRILCNMVFHKSQNACKAGTFCTNKITLVCMQLCPNWNLPKCTISDQLTSTQSQQILYGGNWKISIRTKLHTKVTYFVGTLTELICKPLKLLFVTVAGQKDAKWIILPTSLAKQRAWLLNF